MPVSCHKRSPFHGSVRGIVLFAPAIAHRAFPPFEAVTGNFIRLAVLGAFLIGLEAHADSTPALCADINFKSFILFHVLRPLYVLEYGCFAVLSASGHHFKEVIPREVR